MQLYLILAVLHQIFTPITAILHGQVVRSPQKRVEKNQSGAHERSSICFNAICFCEIVCRYLRKKLQRIALALGHQKQLQGSIHAQFYMAIKEPFGQFLL